MLLLVNQQPQLITTSSTTSIPIASTAIEQKYSEIARGSCSIEPRRYSYSMKIVVVVDNNRFREDLETAWGVSIYVETPKTRFLFDTGPGSDVLEYNARKLGIDLSSLDFVVISHEHGDHWGGIEAIAHHRQGIAVYIPRWSSSMLYRYIEELGLKPIAIDRTTEVAEGIYVLKPLYGPPYEIAAAVKSPRGLVVIVGCSHPGVVKFVKQAIDDIGDKVYAVIGGFHLGGTPLSKIKKIVNDLIELGVEKIYPLHCSGNTIREYLATKYPEKYGDGGVGLEIVFDR